MIDHVNNFLQGFEAQKDEKLQENLCKMMDDYLIPNLFKVRTHQVVSLEQNCFSMQNTNKNPVPVKFLGAVKDMHTNWQKEGRVQNRNHLKLHFSIAQEIMRF